LFDLLKKKLGKFVKKVKGKTETGSEEQETKVTLEEPFKEQEEIKTPEPTAEETPAAEEEPAEEPAEEESAAEEEPEEIVEKTIKEPEQVEEPKAAEEIEEPEKVVEEIKEPELEVIEEPEPKAEEEIEAVKEQAEEPVKEAEPIEEPALRPLEEKRTLKPKISIRGKFKAAITGSVELKESDLKELLWELELSLLEADVEQTTAEEICRKIKERLSGKKIARGKSVEKIVKKEIGEILASMMQTEEYDLLKEVRAKKPKPFKILFLGPNGAGKTTSIAKLTHLLQSKGLKVLWAAGDTFRAASIEQMEVHARKLGVRVIKHQYGADPAAVAFDAVKAAQSKGIDVVLIDSAGRQETNKNLMGELEKITRVIQPDLKIYVGEAFTGQALLQQAKEYDKIAGIDAFILSKIDCDSKGGTTISLLYKMKKPILFVGTGQEYEDLQTFKPEFILKKIIE